MPDPAAPPAAPAAPAPAAERPPDADKLFGHAVEAEKHLEQLATGLAKAGADQGAVKAVSSMAEAMRKVVKGLGKGGTGGQPESAPRETMDSAAEGTVQDLRAARGP